jgi:Putative Ig domain
LKARTASLPGLVKVQLGIQKTLFSLAAASSILCLLSCGSGGPGLTTAPALTKISPLAIVTTQLMSGTVGEPYSCPVTASGGGKPYVWSVALGQLPPGLTLDSSTGVITGVPANPGKTSFTIEVRDSSLLQQQSALASLSLNTLAPPLAFGKTGLPDATLSQPYVAQLPLSGGLAPFSWSIASGSLPSGLTLNVKTGEISGIPTQPGPFNFTAGVTDSSSPPLVASGSFTLNVVVPQSTLNTLYSPLTLGKTGLPDATLSQPYVAQLPFSGGLAPFSWSIPSGSLPSGLTLNFKTGEISGIPTQPGPFEFTAQVTDSSSPPLMAFGSFTLNVVVPQLTIATLSLPQGVQGHALKAQLEAYGGQPPYTWSVIAGSLPAGLQLDPATGMLSGIPSQVETVSFTIQVIDSSAVPSVAKLIFGPRPPDSRH